MRNGHGRGAVVAGLLMLAACGAEAGPRADPPQADPPRAESPGVEQLRGDGFSLLYPADARVQQEVAAAPVASYQRIVGPDVALRPADQDWTLSGAAYWLDVLTYDNPARDGLEEWVNRYLAAGDALSPPRLSAATVAGEPAVRVETFGGDSQLVTYFLARDERVVAIRFAEVPEANSPIAAVQRGIHSLVLSSYRWETAAR